jgi:hypothetical protein
MLKDYTWRIAGLLGAALLFLSGCTGTLKMPINEYSHVRVEATPLSNEFKVSYHLYDALPARTEAPDWTGKIKVDGLGTVYATEESGSPAAKRIEHGWESLWADGSPTWATIERLALDTDEVAQNKPTTSTRKPKAIQVPRRTHIMQLAELPFFLFSRAPQW